jgi:hypothetical protein
MYAAKAGKSTLGIPQKVGADFVAATPSVSNLPKRAPKGKFGRAGNPKAHSHAMHNKVKAGLAKAFPEE